MVHVGKTNYKNSLVNFTSSIMKNYSLKSEYESHALIDYILSKKYKHIAVILLDGLGSRVIDDNLSNGSILKTHQIITLNSVFPPTTVAATTSLTTGKAPIESGWLGWHLYLGEGDPSVLLFKNEEYHSHYPFTKYKVEDKIPQNHFFNNIKKATSYTIYPSFVDGGCLTFKEAVDRLQVILNKDEPNFTYLYWDNPDYVMHEYGTTSQVVRTTLMDIENQITSLYENIPDDTVIFITADHGMINVEPIEVNENDEFIHLMSKPFAGEGRFAQFYVDEENQEQFRKLFNELYGKDFLLYSKEEFLNSKLAGLYNPHNITKWALGDFVAIGITNKFFCDEIGENDMVFKAHHAGLTKEEMEVPLILLKRKDEHKEE